MIHGGNDQQSFQFKAYDLAIPLNIGFRETLTCVLKEYVKDFTLWLITIQQKLEVNYSLIEAQCVQVIQHNASVKKNETNEKH